MFRRGLSRFCAAAGAGAGKGTPTTAATSSSSTPATGPGVSSPSSSSTDYGSAPSSMNPFRDNVDAEAMEDAKAAAEWEAKMAAQAEANTGKEGQDGGKKEKAKTDDEDYTATWDEMAGKKTFSRFGGDARTDAKTFKGGSAFFSGFLSVSIISLGCSFIFVPLYRMYCTPSGRGFDPKFLNEKTKEEKEADQKVHPVRKKLLSVRFLSDVGNTMPVAFVPLQKKLEVLIGEPALAFYSAYNRSERTLLGVSSYTISPPEATAYLNKIQCFCFEEQRFKPHELVEMPVFFYIDKDFLNDPMINWLDEVIINYTFFNLERTQDIIKKM